MMLKMQLALLGVLIDALFPCTAAKKICPQVSLDLRDFGIEDCPPSFQIQTEAELKAILKETQCRSWGKWTMPPSKGCSSPSSLPEGLQLKFPCGCRFGDTCKTGCKTGYEMIGEHTLTCLNTGSWSALPMCMPLKCEPPSLPITMRAEGNCSHREGSECRVSCISPEYQLVGNDRIKCENQMWIHIPKCQMRCNLGDIPSDLVPTHRCEGDEGEICSLKCKSDNVTLYGDKSVKCLGEGQWDRFPYCGCRAEDVPPMVEIESDCPKRVGSGCPAKCLPTYVREGRSDKMHCGPGGKWNLESSIKCAKLCGLPPLSSTMRLKGECAGKEGASCEAECKESYMRLVGSPTFRCLASGKYTELPTCSSPDRCPSDAIPATMMTSACSYLIGVTCTVKCKDSRADLIGSNTIVCQVSGSWTDLPRCEMNCGLPPLTPDLKIEQCATKEGNQCTLRCVPGYEPETDMVITCLSSGQWSGSPKCVKVCSPFSHTDDIVINSGCTRIVNTTCTLTCREPNYKILPTETIECQPDGQWSLQQVECRKQCDGPSFPADSFKVTGSCDFLVGNKCTIECANPSLMIVGSGVVECTDSGQHMTRNICSRQCGTPNLPEGVKVSSQCTTNLPITECEISCTNSLATVTGPTSIKCNEGDWHISSKCEVVCKDPQLKEGSSIVGVCSYQDNSECRVKCNDPAATMDGKSEYIITCKNTEWSEAPHCEVLCDPIDTPPGLQVKSCSRKKGTSCQVICADGRDSLIGSPFFTCDLPSWSGVMPTCVRMCQQPSLPLHSTLRGNCERKIGNKCIVKCQDGFSMTGNPEITCLETQNWTEYPTCKQMCPEVPAHLSVTSDCTRIQGSSCPVKCKDTSKQIDLDVNEMLCNESGSWNVELQCVPVPVCVAPNGTIFQVGCKPGQNDCRVYCEGFYDAFETLNPVFLKEGQNVMVSCDRNGKVSPDKECVVEEMWRCKDLEPPYTPTDRAMFLEWHAISCVAGYELVGQPKAFCQISRWSQLPKCLKKCNVAELIAKGLKIMYEFCKPYANHYCAIDCRPGLPTDYTSAFCDEDGKWSNFPTCEVIPPPTCTVPAQFDYKSHSSGYLLLSCKDKQMETVGPVLVTCLAERKTTPLPTCQPIEKQMQCADPRLLKTSLDFRDCPKKPLYDLGEKCVEYMQCSGGEYDWRDVFCLESGEWSHPECYYEEHEISEHRDLW